MLARKPGVLRILSIHQGACAMTTRVESAGRIIDGTALAKSADLSNECIRRVV